MHSLSGVAWRSVAGCGVRVYCGFIVRCGGVRVLSSFSPPSSPYSGKQGLLLNSFSIELTVQCDGCLIWGLGWQAGLVAGLRVGQAYGVSHRPGFGLLGSVPRAPSLHLRHGRLCIIYDVNALDACVYPPEF